MLWAFRGAAPVGIVSGFAEVRTGADLLVWRERKLDTA
ncbi:hypothetical protein L842_1055 [Mycobacterium intracellulare MIN_052511_1280]|nr:hypothetical protein L842_1055 [Mycobacterium intracellulare MIN_052511_1280]